MLNIAIVGCGSVGTAVLQALAARNDIRVVALIVTARALQARQAELAQLAPGAGIGSTPEPGLPAPDLIAECAGHRAIMQHILPALESGIPGVITSVGALAAPGLPEKLAAAALQGGTRVELLAGALGAIDALSAARHGGLDEVVYTGRKPPPAWSGTPAEQAY